MNTTTSTGTIALLERIHDGDLAALDELLQRDVKPRDTASAIGCE